MSESETPENPRSSNNGKHERNGEGSSSLQPEWRTSRGGAPAKPGSSSKSGSQTEERPASELVSRVRAFLSIIRSRWISGAVVAVLVGVAFVYFESRYTPDQTAVTTMLAQSTMDELLLSSLVPGKKKDSQENFLQNHLSVMKSRRFSVALAKEFTREERAAITAHFMLPGQQPSMASFEGMLAKRTDATRQKNREFFTLSFRHPKPDIAVMVANRMSATYLKLVQEEVKEANERAAEMLRVQAEQLQSEISELEEKQRAFRLEHGIISLEEGNSLFGNRLRRIDQTRSELKITRMRLEAEVREAKEDLEKDEMPFQNPLLASFANTPELREEAGRLEAQKRVFSLRYGRNHPKMRNLEGQIASTDELLKRNFELAYRDLENQYQSSLTMEQELDEEYEETFAQGIEFGRSANQFLVVESEVDAKREALNGLLRRVSGAAMISKLPTDVMRLVDPAYIARPRLSRRKLSFLLGSMLIGTAFFGVPVVRHLFDQRLKGETDVERELGKGLIGGVPRMGRVRAADRPHVVGQNSAPEKVEPFMSIIAQIELLTSQVGPQSFLVTSTAPREGKSTIISNLAAGYAQIGRKTLLVDADMRRPSQHQWNKVKSNSGILSWAEAGCNMDDILAEDSPLGIERHDSGVYLLPASGVHRQPTQFLTSPNIKKLFEALQQRFDVILVDSPPVGLFSDALALAQCLGETILIARESRAPIDQIRRVIADVDNTPAPVLGVVLNDYSRSSVNPRLVYCDMVQNYGQRVVKRKKDAKPAPASKSLVGKLMEEDKG
ncbi:GumC family protein [Pelagicoccus mobilis]|uniref:Polysaccharide biosynthesis tyrosine autokinase n=1 Tax=Pelagicoccus mobilis TaxID=415221 RepID=A0A934RW71_9BACT|nr:polysaccharide biosynthesis tyrosine autokinase [Pelagicoccus mobilis]MBK1877937.1 polysaccharide biosynthesis tyrosine autokinase [Pelagicoccus mobilis]